MEQPTIIPRDAVRIKTIRAWDIVQTPAGRERVVRVYWRGEERYVLTLPGHAWPWAMVEVVESVW